MNPNEYDAIFYVGGHGPLMDLASDPLNTRLATYVYRKNKIIAAICHGPDALLGVKGTTAGIASRERRSLHSQMPRKTSLERKRQENFFVSDSFMPNHGKDIQEKVAIDGCLISGGNPASAYPLVLALKERLVSKGSLEKAREKIKKVV
ncbi:hypothetical protein ACEPAH_1891 [Sanghuangporus vaninii]